ncbi:MAG: Dam family site-specific DNA-(adenine-N6)-methyltransferase [Gemmatimonadota bacterium]|nr:Dam family site-specific DNA-(adenine-N6)-methyltransferase [Gemmatimonadota bacterium]
MQMELFKDIAPSFQAPLKTQLLKWVGNKQRFAHKIVSYFPVSYNKYFEPFLGSGAVLATLAPNNAIASDTFIPLAEIWTALLKEPNNLKTWYSERWKEMIKGKKEEVYEKIKASYNNNPNGADLLFLCRTCYGGIVRFRKSDGFMSTPCGPHNPISPDSFSERVDIWYFRVKNTKFLNKDYKITMELASEGDLIYCDPPYLHSQSILYGAQSFEISSLFQEIRKCKNRGVYVALSIDGTKRSGNKNCDLPIPDGLFEKEIFVNCGRSMLKRFQMEGQSLENYVVADRLLLTY